MTKYEKVDIFVRQRGNVEKNPQLEKDKIPLSVVCIYLYALILPSK